MEPFSEYLLESALEVFTTVIFKNLSSRSRGSALHNWFQSPTEGCCSRKEGDLFCLNWMEMWWEKEERLARIVYWGSSIPSSHVN